MSYHLDVGKLVDSIKYSPEANIQFEVHISKECSIPPGGKVRVKSNFGVYNIPETHYLYFKGIQTNIGISTKEGVFKNDSFGYIYVTIYNSSVEERMIPSEMHLGWVLVKSYSDFTNIDDKDSW